MLGRTVIARAGRFPPTNANGKIRVARTPPQNAVHFGDRGVLRPRFRIVLANATLCRPRRREPFVCALSSDERLASHSTILFNTRAASDGHASHREPLVAFNQARRTLVLSASQHAFTL
jgi:hypothetical protein